MALTIPMLGLPVTISGVDHLNISYDVASAEDVTITAGTYWILGDGSSDCLLEAVEDALNTNTNSMSFTVTLNTSTLKVLITATGADTVDELALDTATDADLFWLLGFGLASGADAASFAAGPPNAYSGSYRPAALWCPSEYDHSDVPTQRDAVVLQAGDDGLGVIDVYSGRTEWEHHLYEVYPPLVRAEYASNATMTGDVDSPTLSTDDTNAALDGWLRRFHGLCGGASPELKWTPDISTLGTSRSVYITTPEMVASVDGWIANTNPAPRHHEMRFTLTEKAS